MDQWCSLQKTEIFLLFTLAKNKALIIETIDVFQEYINMLDILIKLNLAKIIINKDLMTVQNITWLIHWQQDKKLRRIDQIGRATAKAVLHPDDSIENDVWRILGQTGQHRLFMPVY